MPFCLAAGHRAFVALHSIPRLRKGQKGRLFAPHERAVHQCVLQDGWKIGHKFNLPKHRPVAAPSPNIHVEGMKK
jgi:hypothetical protein